MAEIKTLRTLFFAAAQKSEGEGGVENLKAITTNVQEQLEQGQLGGDQSDSGRTGKSAAAEGTQAHISIYSIHRQSVLKAS